MDDIREQMDLANEISDAISQPVNFGVDFDEEELTLELEALEQEELDGKLLDVGLEGLPSAPVDVPGNDLLILGNHELNLGKVWINSAIAQAPRPEKTKKVRDDVDDELAALQASMAMN
jgi:charged multivesicular body protein 4A/B